MDVIKIAIVDDHAIVSDGFKQLIDIEEDLTVVAVFRSYSEAVTKLPYTEVDMIIVDILLPDTSGIVLMNHISKHHPNINIIALSMYDKEPYISEALRSGAKAYLSKRIAPDEIIVAIRAVLNNKSYFSEDVKANMADIKDSLIQIYLLSSVSRVSAAAAAACVRNQIHSSG